MGRYREGDSRREEEWMALSNSQFDAIMRVYNQRQFLNKRRQDERIREVYERIPPGGGS